MSTMIAGWDIDGTLIEKRPEVARVPYDDPDGLLAATRVIPEAIDYALSWQRMGYEMVFITGRSEKTRAVTQLQLERVGLRVDQLHMQERFTTMDALFYFKEVTLRQVSPVFYAGDHHIDAAAARRAGIPFKHARELTIGVAA